MSERPHTTDDFTRAVFTAALVAVIALALALFPAALMLSPPRTPKPVEQMQASPTPTFPASPTPTPHPDMPGVLRVDEGWRMDYALDGELGVMFAQCVVRTAEGEWVPFVCPPCDCGGER